MATITKQVVTDDLDNTTEDVLTCYVALGEGAVEIDLSPDNRVELEEFLAKYFEAGRPVRQRAERARRAARAKSASPTTDKTRMQAIRKWGIENGYQVSERGRIPNTVVE